MTSPAPTGGRTGDGLPSPTVHRFTLSLRAEQDLALYPGAHPLHVLPGYLGAGHGNPIIELWCHVDLDGPREMHRFYVCGNGLSAPADPAGYVGTVVIPGLGDRRDVWHVFHGGPVRG